ncbi:RpoE-regulated lipoprotein [Erwinia phyllosphaerae]|uniref:RpoE-regulated lipoprotein n=1 Tax=Erwinia phyllosphaerae TaxID=2853256 RepID=UPI001FEEC4D7|nr:RpoE-regulated lipoprotein [Erwinia phyllosphaerae]MBV4368023.1 RpoE-regulated lipoprotein [Erwinia phyllosphaerae]
MKTVRPLVLVTALMMAGCASSEATAPASSGATWWNPLTYSWSSLAPWHWFGSSVEVSEQGVGGLNGATAMNEKAIGEGLSGNYQVRKGMRGENGNVITFFQALDDKQVKVEVLGDTTVSQIDVTDSDVKTSTGIKIGTPFSDLYSRAFGSCYKASGSDGVECKAPDSQHISYVFSGEWHGPEGLLPADDALKNWKVSKIIWRR